MQIFETAMLNQLDNIMYCLALVGVSGNEARYDWVLFEKMHPYNFIYNAKIYLFTWCAAPRAKNQN